eukprot:COSAG02_NODE_10333_length_1966_cov_2.076058_2_plen_272_part_00
MDEGLESCESLPAAVAASGLDVAFSDLPHANGAERIYFMRRRLIPSFLEVAKEMNQRGWVLKVEDAYRTRDMQAALGRRPALFEAILAKVIWELQSSSDDCAHGVTDDRDPGELARLLIRRVAALIAAAPKVGTHMSGSAVDISVLDAATREEIDRGAPYLELSELTPMDSPFISHQAATNRREITAIFARRGFSTYPYEFWHYNAGDAYQGLLQGTGSHIAAQYGAVELDLGSGAVRAMTDTTAVLNSAETMRGLMDAALEKLELSRPAL